MIHLTVKNGWCETTPYTFSGYGFLLAALGQETEAFRFSQLALRSQRGKRAQPDVNMMIHSFLSHFERPATYSLRPLLDGYRSGLETGSMMCGTICICCYAHVYLFCGLPLGSFANDMLMFGKQLTLCHQDLSLAFVLPALQLALNLTGQTRNPIDVSKDSMKALDIYKDTMFQEETEDPATLFVFYMQALGGFLFGSLDVVERAFNRIFARKTKRLEGTQILNLLFTVVDGVAGYALCRRKNQRKYRKLAQTSIKELWSLQKKRSMNSGGILALLKAEEAAFSRRPARKVNDLFDCVSVLT